VYGRLYAGIYGEVMYYDATYPDPNGTFARTDVPGEDGGFTGGLGPMMTFDSRDNAVSSRSGSLVAVTWLGFGPYVGSEHDFWKLQTEVRHFFPIGEASALALRYYGEFQGGDVPYYQLAMLGGDELLRGYFMGRYRDKDMLVLETEYRFPLFWRFGATVFAGAGEVADRAGDLASVPIHWAFGGGLRLALNTRERLNLRLDVGLTPDILRNFPDMFPAVYFTAAEAF
jgi:outer membrane protein assembly factor BamA